MHFCTCVVAITEDAGNTVHRNEFNPVSWPEIEVISVLHGYSAVSHVIPFVKVRQTPDRERDRLLGIYGPIVVQQVDAMPAVYPGRHPNMTLEAPDFTVRPGLKWFNPISFRMEAVGEDGFSVEVEPETYEQAVMAAQSTAEMATPAPAPEVVGNLPQAFLASQATQKAFGKRRSAAPESQKANYDDKPDAPF
jgi:hypothetical protein